MKTTEVMKKITTKGQLIDFLEAVKPNANVDGQNSIDFIIESLNGKIYSLADAKMEALKTLEETDGEYFDDKTDKKVLFENSLKEVKEKSKTKRLTKPTKGGKKTEKEVNVTDEEAEQLLNAFNKKADKKLDANKIIELCGYRYTYPVFPETFELEEAFEGKVFTRIDSDDIKEVDRIINEQSEDTYRVVSVVYFPEYERDFEIDPHYALGVNASKKTLLKAFGGKYPKCLDIQTIFHFDTRVKTMVTCSNFTGIPYVTALSDKWFTTNDDLHCRVSQNGLDYQLYKVTDK